MRTLCLFLACLVLPALAAAQGSSQAQVTIPLPLKAVGHDPGWTLDIGAGQLVFVHGPDQRRLVVPVGQPTAVPGGQRFDGRSDERSLSVTVVAGRCTDAMSGLPRPFTVTVRDGDAELRGCAGDATAVLRGGMWVVESIQDVATVPKSRVTLVFSPGGRVEGTGGCNRYVASYVLTGDQLQVTMPISSMRACAPPLIQQERAFLDVLRSVQRFAIDADGALVLTGADGSSIRARR